MQPDGNSLHGQICIGGNLLDGVSEPIAPQKQYSVLTVDGIQKTIEWYLNNREWWETIISGEYQDYYEKMYANRGK